MTEKRGRARGWLLAPLALWCVSGWMGCDGSGGAMKAQTPEARAKLLWEHRCAACHGMTGKGDGEAAPGLLMEAVPRDLTDPQWQKGVADAYLARVIVKGGASVGLSHVMSPNPDLEDDPKAVAELVKIVRGLKAKETTTGGVAAPKEAATPKEAAPPTGDAAKTPEPSGEATNPTQTNK